MPSSDYNHRKRATCKDTDNSSPPAVYPESDLTHSGSMLLGCLDVGRVIYFRTLSQLEEGVAEFLSRNLPGLLNKTVEKNAARWSTRLDLGKLLKIWRDAASAHFTRSSGSAELTLCQKAYIKQKSFISIVKKLRNSFAHGEIFMPTALKGIIHAATKLLPVCSPSPFKAPLVNVKHLFSKKEGDWSTAQWVLPLLQTEEASIMSRSFQSTAKDLFGREVLINDLVQTLTNTADEHRDCHRILLHGPRGVGKTAVVRQLSKQLAQHYPRQSFFQASSKEAFLSDIQLFMSTQGCSNKEMDFFRKFLQTSDKFLLVFEDVDDPLSVLSFLPEGRHSVIFTSASDLLWADQGLLNECVEIIKINSLSTADSLLLMERVFIDCRKHNLFQDHMQGILSKRRIVSTLEEDLKNVPLAVRLFSYQLAQESTSLRESWQPEWPYVTGTERSDEDQHAAGCVHVRGFHHAVRSSLEILSENVAARQLCFACSLLPKSSIQMWFLQLVGEELGLRHHETNTAVFTLISLGLLTKITTEPESDREVRQHCIVQCHLRQIMTKSGKKLVTSISSLVQKAVKKKLSCLWCYQNLSVQGSSLGVCREEAKTEPACLDARECLHLFEIISSIFRFARKIELGYDDFSELRFLYSALERYLGYRLDFFKSAKRRNMIGNYHNFFLKDLHSCQTSANDPEWIRCAPPSFLSRCMVSHRRLVDTIIPLLASDYQQHESYFINDYLLDLVTFAPSCIHYHRIEKNCLHLAVEDFLCQYSNSGNFACLSPLLQVCSACFKFVCTPGTQDVCFLAEFCESLFNKVLSVWLEKGYRKGFWWEASDICFVGHQLSKFLRSAEQPRRALFWCEVTFLVVTDTKNALQPFFNNLGIISTALSCCITSPPEDHGDFFKWFGRFYQAKTSLQSMSPSRQGNRFVLRSLATAWVYLDRYVEQSDGILLAITHDLIAIATDEMIAFLDEYCHGRYVSATATIYLALFIAPERNRLELVQRLMKTLMTSLHRSPVKCQELLEFPNRLTNILYKEYFALSQNEKCFLLEFISAVVSKFLSKHPLEFKNPSPASSDSHTEKTFNWPPAELSMTFERCLRTALSEEITNHATSMCFQCSERMAETSFF